MKADIAKLTTANGKRLAVKKQDIPDPAICGFNNKPYKEGHFGDKNDLESIPFKKWGGYKLLPEEIDEKLLTQLKLKSAATAIS